MRNIKLEKIFTLENNLMMKLGLMKIKELEMNLFQSGFCNIILIEEGTISYEESTDSRDVEY